MYNMQDTFVPTVNMSLPNALGVIAGSNPVLTLCVEDRFTIFRYDSNKYILVVIVSTNFLIDAELIIDASTSNMMCSFDFDRAPAMQHQSMFVGDCAVWSRTAHNYYAKTPVWMRNNRTFFIQF
ncbi:hypothetical protein TVAG_021930 [Trichomonas vaginalis G3]|uniref:Uncharacterized protein n=1 Tax=Trichomonas vaginalis (strain ATCC PRA-98 / G3) TaxID=412133 RepID=A2DHH2_TRIV3|nr:hypothetical protein TVAGG3_0678750 [Trichomonas vaginalis G3]EAY20245.1 hypothetical protein TVAG_021930 [Trichomonas vaginalis G3]KAI5507740.1 hypothetical protein TVAGG3_0678750 [Trichomonas vaginalis G3]|eukprot:XP_001581231.1 hypothetical protein [Trichomonas vaginalis G3]